MKLVHASLNVREDRESHCGRPVRLVQACLDAGKT